MYHRFSPDDNDHPRRLPGRELDWQLSRIARDYRNWMPDDQLGALTGFPPGPSGPPVVITVDDGYSGFAEIAWPLLRRYGLAAMVFLTTGFVAGETWFWWDRLSWLLENCPAGHRTFTFDGNSTAGNPADEEERWTLWHRIADHLSVIDDAVKESAITALAKEVGLTVPTTAPEGYAAMNWDQIRALYRQGVRFGAHTVTHPVLSRVDPARAEWEIRESGRRLAAELGQPVNWFCYPQGTPGDFGPETIELVRRAGYTGCYTAYPDARHDGCPLTLPRYSAPADRTNFLWALCGAEHIAARIGLTKAAPQHKEA